MDPRKARVSEATPVLRTGSPRVRRYKGRVVEFKEAPNRDRSRVEREFDGRRLSERRAKEGGSHEGNLPTLLVAHLGKSENGQPLYSTLTSKYEGNQPSTNLGGSLPPNGKDCAQNIKNQSKTRQYQHKIGSLQQKPDQQAIFSNNQAMKLQKIKIQSLGSILAYCSKSKSRKKNPNSKFKGSICQFCKEPSYNQNYDDNYYPHNLSSFPCCDNCGVSHETFRCQPMAQNIDFSGSDQIQTPQYPDVHTSSQEISDEVFHAKEDLMKSIQTFLEEFNCKPFEEKATILLQDWFRFFAIKHDQPENSNELFQKLLEDLKELAEEEYSVEVCEEQKQKMEDSMLELVVICRQKELLCIYDNIDDLIESALNTKLLSINSQRFDKKQQEVKNVVEKPAERGNRSIEKSLQNFRVIRKSSTFLKNTSQIPPIHAITPILSTKEHEYSPSIGYEHSNTTPKIESYEIIKSGVEELVPILSKNEVTLEDKRECDMPIWVNSPVCDNHSEIFLDSRNDDDISSDDDDFEDIEYVEASLTDPKIVSIEEENVVHQEEEETRSGNTTHANDSFPEYDSFCFEIEPDQERLINVVKNDISDNSSNDPLLEEADLFLASDNSIPPGIENFTDDSEVDIHFLEELLIDDSIPFPNNESPDYDFDNPSIPRPPPEPPDAKTDAEEEILVMMNDELECLRNEFDDDYYSFMFDKVFSFLSAKSEDTIFDPGFTPHRLKFLVFGYLSRSKRSSHPFFEISLGKSISLISIA
nr:hypothetical protein [Tanacetum cinerariifolium]